MDALDKLRIINTEMDDTVNAAAAAYRIISAEPENTQVELFTDYIREHYAFIDHKVTRDAPELISREDALTIIKKYDNSVDAIIDKHIRLKSEESEFYKDVWSFINGIKRTDARYAVMFMFASNRRMPYFKIKEPKKVDSEEIRDLYETAALLGRTAKTRFIINCGFEKISDVAYAILDQMNELEKEEDKMMVLYELISLHQEDMVRLRRLFEFLREDDD